MNRMTVLFLALIVSTAGAQPADKLVEIRGQQKLLAAELDSGDLKVTPREAALIRKEQAVVFKLLEANAMLEDMNVEERVRLDNALERINALLVGTRQAAEQRDDCRYERVSGSKHRKLVCATSDERQHARDGARAYMEKPRICIPPGCGS